MLNRIRQHVTGSFSRKSHPASEGLCAIRICPQTIAVAYIKEQHSEPTLQICKSYPYTNETTLLSTLSTLVKNEQLKNVSCSLILQPEEYQILITDNLPVTAAEFQDAIRWKIKDIIHLPIHDVVIDHFPMPKMIKDQNKIMVVAAQTSKLTKISRLITESGLNLKYIDLPELALRNVNTLYEKGDETVSLIYVQESTIELLFTADQKIYVSRLLKFSLNTEDPVSMVQGIERLSAEIQRSFDYYQSLWNRPLPTQFIFSSIKPVNPEAVNQLSQRIKIPVQIINIADKIKSTAAIPSEEQGEFLLVIGGALRESITYATAD